MNRLKIKKTKTKNKNKNSNTNMSGGGGEPPIDLANLPDEDVKALLDQGILPEQIVEMAEQQNQQPPPLIQAMLQQGPQPEVPLGMEQQQQQEEGGPPPPQILSKTGEFPAMMDATTYGNYREVEKSEKSRTGAHKPSVFGYEFSDLISEEILQDMKRTQGSFFIGVNLSNLFNEFSNLSATDGKDPNPLRNQQGKKNPENIFKRIGEWIDVDYDKTLDKKMGFRGSNVPLLPEDKLTDYSTFTEVIGESKKYATTSGYDNKITPYGLLIMTRMLFKYRKSNAQWIRVATILELIYKYLGSSQAREIYFKNNDSIPITALMELEEFYNTDHIFMTDKELTTFKKDLNFYKYDKHMDISKQIRELRKKVPPI